MYADRIKTVESLKAAIHEKSISAEAYQTALRIVVTLRVMERYQKEKMVSESDYKKLLDDYRNTIKKTEAVIMK